MTVFSRGDRERLTSELFHFYLNQKILTIQTVVALRLNYSVSSYTCYNSYFIWKLKVFFFVLFYL